MAKRINKKTYSKKGRDSQKVSPYYIGTVSKKDKYFAFVDAMNVDELENIKTELDFTKFKLAGHSIKNVSLLENSIYVPKENISVANNGDVVLVTLKKGAGTDRLPEGKIEYVLKRNKGFVIGTVHVNKDNVFVIPADTSFISDIYIVKKSFDVQDGDIVQCEIISYKNKVLTGKNSTGVITKVIAKNGANYKDLEVLLAENSVSKEYPKEAQDQARQMQLVEEDLKNVKDLTELFTVTIDGEDAKDLDDAISLFKDEYYHLYVHIADVSRYVKQDSPLDKEALKRGNSIYLLNTVIPMLPVELSNGICSLNANEPRAALTAEIKIDKDGNIVWYDIYKSKIKVDKRMSYNQVEDILAGNLEVPKEEHNFYKLLDRLTKTLIQKRVKHGYISLDIPEFEVILDDVTGKAISVKEKEEKFSYKMIEHMMLTANLVVSEFFDKKANIIFRVHESPSIQKVMELNETLKKYGLEINIQKKDNKKGVSKQVKQRSATGSKQYVQSQLGKEDKKKLEDTYFVPQKEYNRILEIIKNGEIHKIVDENGKEIEVDIDPKYLSYLLLRSMREARYERENKGHFGIGFDSYCHFTSPIRRYSDLYTHRKVSEYLAKNNNTIHNPNEEVFFNTDPAYLQRLDHICSSISGTERKAQKMENDYKDLKIAEFMEQFLGQKFAGTITGITNFGIFVDLGKSVEGCIKNIHIQNKNQYHVGQKVYVLVSAISKEKGNVDLIFADNDEDPNIL